MRRGEVVLVRFPFSSGAGAKVRPAVVVQNDQNNGRLISTIVAMITSTTKRAASLPTQMLIDPANAEGHSSGLLRASAVTCENLFTLDQALVLRSIGVLTPALISRLNDCLKASLDLG